MMSMRAHSPSPIRKHGSLLDLFDTMTTNNVSMTQGLTNMAAPEKPKKLTAREVDETFEGEIPETSYADLPPNFNEISERKRIADNLFIEKLDH